MTRNTLIFMVGTIQAFIILATAYQALQISRLLNNRRLTRFFYKIAVVMAAFFAVRFAAAWFDSFLITAEVGYASIAVTLIFWSLIFYRCRAARLSLKNHLQPETQAKVADAFDALIADMTASKNRAAAELAHLT